MVEWSKTNDIASVDKFAEMLWLENIYLEKFKQEKFLKVFSIFSAFVWQKSPLSLNKKKFVSLQYCHEPWENGKISWYNFCFETS